MKLTISGTPSEVEAMINRLSFGNKDPTDVSPPSTAEQEEEYVKVINLYKDVTVPNLFDPDPTPTPKEPIETIAEVKGKVFRRGNDSKNVDILFDTGILYKRFVSAAAAGAYFGKANLSENLRHNAKFRYNDIWFTIKYSNN